MSKYTSGVLYVSYFLLNHLQGRSLTFTANFSTLLVNSSIFDLTTAAPVTFTVSTTPEALMICCTGYFMAYNPLRCD